MRTYLLMSLLVWSLSAGALLQATPPQRLLDTPWTTPDDVEGFDENDIVLLCQARLEQATKAGGETREISRAQKLITVGDVFNIVEQHFGKKIQNIKDSLDDASSSLTTEEKAAYITQLHEAFKQTLSGEDNELAEVIRRAISIMYFDVASHNGCSEIGEEHREQVLERAHQILANVVNEEEVKEAQGAVKDYLMMEDHTNKIMLSVPNNRVRIAKTAEHSFLTCMLLIPFALGYTHGPAGFVAGAVLASGIVALIYGETGTGTDGWPSLTKASTGWWGNLVRQANLRHTWRVVHSFSGYNTAMDRWFCAKLYTEDLSRSSDDK